MNSRHLIALASLPLLLAGCAQNHSFAAGHIDPADFGEANRQTYAAMVIDPDPQYDEPLATSAEHAADAVEAYRAGTVERPERISSTTSVSGGGN